MRPRSSTSSPAAAAIGDTRTPVVHSTASRIDDLAVVEGDTVGHHLDDLDAGMDLHTEPIQALMQPGPRLGAHHRAWHLTAQQDDVQFGMLLGDFRRRLDAGEPAACHHDGAVGEPAQLFGQQRRVLCAVQGVGEFVDAWDRLRVGDAAQRVDQGVVAQRVRIIDADGLRIGVDAGHPAQDEIHPGVRRADRGSAGQPVPGRRRSGAGAAVR